MLRAIEKRGEWPWMVFGDFNEILLSSEMAGKHERNINQMRMFRNALLDCQLMDIGCGKQSKVTFLNRRKGN